MKKIAVLLLAAMLGLTACASGGVNTTIDEPDAGDSGSVAAEPLPVSQPLPVNLPEPETVWTAAEGITFSLLQDGYPVGTERMTLVIENRSDAEVEWGTGEQYEKFVDGQWEKLDGMDELAFTDELLLLKPESVRTQELTALRWAKPLNEGLYRVTGSAVFVDGVDVSDWQVTFRVAADAVPEPDYALYISCQPLPIVEGCLVMDRIPVFFINTTGVDGCVLDIPHLEKMDENGTWAEIPYQDHVGFCGTPSTLRAEGRKWSEELLYLWGPQDEGRYRLSYQVGADSDTKETISAEFVLYAPENNAGLPLMGQE